MISINIKSLLSRLNPYCTRSLEAAAGLCVSRTHYEVTVEHLLSKLLDDTNADFSIILNHFNIDAGQVQKAVDISLEEYRTGNAAKPVFSPLLMDWIQDSWLTSSVDLEENRIRSGALMLSLLNRIAQLTGGRYAELLNRISRDELMSQFRYIVKNSSEKPSRIITDSGGTAETRGTTANIPILC